jgi:hypothetical protein
MGRSGADKVPERVSDSCCNSSEKIRDIRRDSMDSAPWLLGAVGSLRSWSGRAFNWLVARRAANPAGFWLTTFALLAFIIGGYAGWQWYEHLPQPYYLQVSVTRPGPTPLEPNEPPYPLDIQFSGSAVRLGAKFRSTSTRVFGLVLATPAKSLPALSSSGPRIF